MTNELPKKKSKSEEFVSFPDLAQKQDSKLNLLLIISIAFIILTCIAYFIVVRQRNGLNNQGEMSKSLEPTPSPTPLVTPKPLPTGNQVYNFSHGKDVFGPKPAQMTVSPIDPKLNQDQKIVVTIAHPLPITKTKLTLVTDTKSQDAPLTFVKKEGDLEYWEATWKMIDTYNRQYQINIMLSDGQAEFNGGLTIR